ncbi:MAG: cupin domain-containing protein [Candidatus Tectomicrobia bacterium]|nr:cupin domain-containing protein [Candidatus Tectomicrobia bacterium]
MTENTFKILPDSAGEKTTSNLIPTACFTTEENDETTQRFYDAEDGSVAVGVWECPPCKVDIENYPVNEMMTIISGALIMTNAEGVEETFGPGEVVFVPKGSKITWHIIKRLRKYYMTSS